MVFGGAGAREFKGVGTVARVDDFDFTFAAFGLPEANPRFADKGDVVLFDEGVVVGFVWFVASDK